MGKEKFYSPIIEDDKINPQKEFLDNQDELVER